MTQEFARITDDMVERGRRRVGLEKPVRNQTWEVATKDALRHFAWANGDLNPLWTDEDYARKTSWGGLIAPPHFPMADHMTPLYPMGDLNRKSKGEGFPGIMAMISLWEFSFHAPIRVNEPVRSIEKTVGVVDSERRHEGDLVAPHADFARAFGAADNRRGASSGRMVDQIADFSMYASGRLAASCLLHYVRIERGVVSPEEGKFKDLQPPKYSPQDLKTISDAYENEFRRGQAPLRWEDFAVGDSLSPVMKGPLTVLDMVVYLSGVPMMFNMMDRIKHLFLNRFPAANFPDPDSGAPDVPERAHWDTWMANSLGWPRGYDFGPQGVSAFSYLLTNWMGDDSLLRELKVWRVRPLFLHEAMWVRGKITKKERTPTGATIEVELWADTFHSTERVYEGTAKLALKLSQ